MPLVLLVVFFVKNKSENIKKTTTLCSNVSAIVSMSSYLDYDLSVSYMTGYTEKKCLCMTSTSTVLYTSITPNGDAIRV